MGSIRPKKKVKVEREEGFRMAGKSTEKLDKKMMALVLKKIEEQGETSAAPV